MTGRGRPSEGPVREVRIPDELWELLRLQASAAGMPVSAYIRRVLWASESGVTPPGRG